MNKIMINLDMEGDTLNVWLDDPQKERPSQEKGIRERLAVEVQVA